MTTIPGRFIEAHIIQAIPFANLNRDDTNAVKTVTWGGKERTRVSSQCWKRAMRLYLQTSLGQEAALRTRRLPEYLARHLEEHHGWPADLAERAGRHIVVASSVGGEAPKKKTDGEETGGTGEHWSTAAMVYIPSSAVPELAELAIQYREALENAKEPKDPAKFGRKDSVIPTGKVDEILRRRNGVINLFGRMLAQVDDAEVDGAVQVAHAFTTHATTTEIDYFSAVDDVTDIWGDTTGSAHMGQAEHSAGVLYRYIVLDLNDLHANLGGDLEATRELAAGLLKAALLSLPRAKKNSTAPHTIPHLAHLTVRTDRPVSYAGAFEKPVPADRHGGHSEPSVAALNEYAAAVQKLLGTSGCRYAAHATLSQEKIDALGERVESFDKLIEGALAGALDGREAA
ncbi:type I-E CRISPR-associated protein Cas7/Cse4/CasC [Thermomonospora curvata]|uniref:CRISPR-associated protein, Cse4 family n=1 Tax=Thermomonospora curvata (strain ATCC 19995 / DSM 43183 / JCM 3096 / KCTC 9072 / NBRC 15933 / NCIMB 10081 / Henssen B9) TaxID=471852 RepID=D1A6Q4_THECD|nr:type I-E CRISPR-associated protein Cas7/Cse4/CasC [Thermomonospora curvata]ACY96529.1 CRISPR-associated protein, Cse4 family [Thermomonospora curvata DSM 43183]